MYTLLRMRWWCVKRSVARARAHTLTFIPPHTPPNLLNSQQARRLDRLHAAKGPQLLPCRELHDGIRAEAQPLCGEAAEEAERALLRDDGTWLGLGLGLG